MIIKSCLWFAVVVCVATVSAQQPERNYAASPNPHIRLFASVLRESVWPNPWIFRLLGESGAGLRNARRPRSHGRFKYVRKGISRSFVGWQPRAAENAGVRIRIDDSGPHTKGLGRRLDRRRDGMVLNFDFKNWSQSCASMREYCVKGIACP